MWRQKFLTLLPMNPVFDSPKIVFIDPTTVWDALQKVQNLEFCQNIERTSELLGYQTSLNIHGGVSDTPSWEESLFFFYKLLFKPPCTGFLE